MFINFLKRISLSLMCMAILFSAAHAQDKTRLCKLGRYLEQESLKMDVGWMTRNLFRLKELKPCPINKGEAVNKCTAIRQKILYNVRRFGWAVNLTPNDCLEFPEKNIFERKRIYLDKEALDFARCIRAECGTNLELRSDLALQVSEAIEEVSNFVSCGYQKLNQIDFYQRSSTLRKYGTYYLYNINEEKIKRARDDIAERNSYIARHNSYFRYSDSDDFIIGYCHNNITSMEEVTRMADIFNLHYRGDRF